MFQSCYVIYEHRSVLNAFDTALEYLTKYVTERMKILSGVRYNLMFASSSNDSEIFHEAYKHLKTLAIELPTTSTSLDLKTALLQLYNAKNEEAALRIYTSQSDFWKTLKYSQADLDKNMRFLARHIPYPDLLEHVLSKEDFLLSNSNFLQTILMHLDRIFHEKLSKQYKECLWVLYVGTDTKLDVMRKTLETEWKEDNYIRRIDRFCQQFDSLYQILSYVDFLVPKNFNLAPLLEEYRPVSEDYVNFIKSLAVFHNNTDVRVVVSVLCPFPLPPSADFIKVAG